MTTGEGGHKGTFTDSLEGKEPERTCIKCGGELLTGNKFKCVCPERQQDGDWKEPAKEWRERFNKRWEFNGAFQNIPSMPEIVAFIEREMAALEEKAMLRQRHFDQTLIEQALAQGRREAAEVAIEVTNEVARGYSVAGYEAGKQAGIESVYSRDMVEEIRAARDQELRNGIEKLSLAINYDGKDREYRHGYVRAVNDFLALLTPQDTERCTKCNAPFEAHHHKHITREGIYHTSCYESIKSETK